MYWIIAALVLLPTLLIPRFRPAGVIGCIVLAAMLGWGMVQRWANRDVPAAPADQQRGSPTSPAPTRVALPPALLSLSDVRMSGSGAPFELRGTVANASADTALRTMTVQITRRDCYAAALDPSGCITLWQTHHWINVSVPPRESRQFAVSIWPHGVLPRIRGTVQDQFAVLSAVGEASAQK